MKSLFFILSFALLPSAFGVISALQCFTKPLEEHFQTCNNKTLCLSHEKKCFESKVSACFCMTVIGGAFDRGQVFDFEKYKIYGNYCGWRNASKPLDWFSIKENKDAVQKLSAIDQLDQICLVHDLEYGIPDYDICTSDQRAISRMKKLASETKDNLIKEKAKIMVSALEKNSLTCHLLNLGRIITRYKK